MSRRDDSMRSAQGLLTALQSVNVTPPKVLQNLVDGFEILGPPVQPATADPAATLVDAAVAGKLTAKSLDELLARAAAEATTNTYRQEFRLKAERKFARRFHTALVDGAADEVLDGIRPQFEAVSVELAAARDAVDLQATPERLLNVTASEVEQDSWRRLPDLVRQINQLAAIAAAFGPNADLAVIDDLTDADSLLTLGWLDDRALMCTGGNGVTACNAFRQPNPNWQTSPWLRVQLKLATIAEAQEKYRELAEGDWAARESHRSGSGTLTERGFVPDIRDNPHALREPAEATV